MGMRKGLMVLCVVMVSVFAISFNWNKSYNVGKNPTLNISSSDASIEVRASSSDRIDVNLDTEGYSINGSSPDIQVSESQAGDNVTVTFREHNRTHFCFACTRHARVTVKAPAGTRLTLHTSDGSLRVYDIKAPAELSTSDGSIEVYGFDGSLHAR